jgi:integrase
MASIQRVGKRWRALVRKAGHTECKTFGTRKLAESWSTTVEHELDQLKSTGFMQPKGKTLADIIDRYITEVYPLKPWGRSKSADLKLLKKALGSELVSNLSHGRIMEAFTDMHDEGAGGVTISARAGYLITVLSTAKDVWRLNVPLDAAVSARSALSKLGLIKKSKHRDRRVSDAEIKRIIEHLERKATALPLAAILWFSVASAARISETCRLQWADLNEADKTIRIRDRKHPSEKMGNHQIVPDMMRLKSSTHSRARASGYSRRTRKPLAPISPTRLPNSRSKTYTCTTLGMKRSADYLKQTTESSR